MISFRKVCGRTVRNVLIKPTNDLIALILVGNGVAKSFFVLDGSGKSRLLLIIHPKNFMLNFPNFDFSRLIFAQ